MFPKYRSLAVVDQDGGYKFSIDKDSHLHQGHVLDQSWVNPILPANNIPIFE